MHVGHNVNDFFFRERREKEFTQKGGQPIVWYYSKKY